MIAITAIFKEITFQKQRILKKENDITTPLYITRPLFQRVENPWQQESCRFESYEV